jgi:hypothetical protein
MRTTTLKRTAKGYVRSLGRLADAATPPRFLLGHDRSTADNRLAAIIEIWNQCEAKNGGYWTPDALAQAKAVARGDVPTINKRDHEEHAGYTQRIDRMKSCVPVNADPAMYELGRADLMHELQTIKAKLFGLKNQHRELTGQTLWHAIEAFRRSLMNKDEIKDGETTLAKQLRAIPTYVTDCDLGELDYMGVDAVYDVFRNRPTTARYGERMKRKSAHNMLSALNQFFKWLHLHADWQWRKPEDYAEISRAVAALEGDDERDAQEHPTWTVDELKTLYRVARPMERVLMLLGLNCSYGADQAGTLRESRVQWTNNDRKRGIIHRIRKKRGTNSIHILFRETERMLRWALEHKLTTGTNSPYLLVNGNGKPMWYQTKGKNRSMQIPSMWHRLLRRVRKDQPDFRQLPFNVLRDTSADMIEKIAGSDIASIHLAHKHLCGDKSLRNYVNPNRKAHARAIRKLERKLATVWCSVDSTDTQPKNYIGLNKIDEIKRLRASGLPLIEVAKICGVSAATVSRYAPKFRHKKREVPRTRK